MRKSLWLVIVLLLVFLVSCEETTPGNVKKVDADVVVNAEGLTIEQENIKNRVEEDNKIGTIKHLYVISAYSGQVILYSTVDGKVTSSGKRLNPYIGDKYNNREGTLIYIRGEAYSTNEVIQDDGTFGHSAEYLYWWDTRNIYHQHYVSGGQIIHISSEPIVVKEIIINLNNVK